MILQKQIDLVNINWENSGVLEQNVENFSTIENAANKSYKKLQWKENSSWVW